MEAATATRQTPMPVPDVFVAHHTHAEIDSLTKEVVGYYDCERVTCRRHGGWEEFDTPEQAQRAAKDPSSFCDGCCKEWAIWELANPPRFTYDDRDPADEQMREMEQETEELYRRLEERA